MRREVVVEIDVTYKTLTSEVGVEFTPESKEYVVAIYDDEAQQIEVIDYGYRTKADGETTIKGTGSTT